MKFLIIILFICIPVILSAQGLKTKVINPKNITTRVPIIISQKSKFYNPLSINNPSIISVKGPGKLKVITRVRFADINMQLQNYKVYYRIDGFNKIQVEFTNVKKSTNAHYKDRSLGEPGIGEDIILEIGIGEHSIEFWSDSDSPLIDARYLFARIKENKIVWVSLSPSTPCEPVDLVTNENPIRYYRFSKEKPLKLRINGPTILKILNRLENHYTMKGRINYRLQVKEDGIVKNTYLLNSVRSDVTTYRNYIKKIPGKAKEIVIDVPSGTHSYEISPLDQDKNTVLGRVLFPKKDINLGD